MTQAIRWGILGASNFALNFMAPAIQLANDATLEAIATRDPARAKPFASLAPGLRVHDSYDALLADPMIDAVYVPLPHTMHVEWSRKALAAGKPVLCEKPLAMRAADIDPLIEERDAARLPAAEAYMIVHHPQWKRAKTLLSEGAIGALRQVCGVFSYNNPDPANIRNRTETGGGSLPDIGVYTIGSTRFATGQEPLRIARASLTRENGVEVTARVVAEFDGFEAQWVTSMRMHPQQEMTFYGEDGWMRLTAPFNPGTFGEARLELRSTERGERIERFTEAKQYTLQIEAFGRAVRGETPFPWSLEDARATQSVIDAIYAAA